MKDRLGSGPMHVIWYTGMSMDGRIASAGDDLAFLDTIGPDSENGEDFPGFIASVDAVLIGASTLRWLLKGGHGWPHDDLPTWLVTHDADLVARVGKTRAPLHQVAGDLGAAFAAMEAAGRQRVWLAGGGNLAGQALALDRVDEIIATIAPTVLGAGPSLFDGAALPARRFRLVECRAIGGDAARLVWRRAT